MKVRDRIKKLVRVKASELIPNPKNWRTHPKKQQEALRGILDEVGIADALIARELPDGSLMLIDGHLRAETTSDQKVPVLVLDLDEAEADKILATLDPLSAMADSDAAKLEELLRGVETDSEELQKLIASTANAAGLYQELSASLKDYRDDDLDDLDEDPPPSGVRMIQLFLDETNITEFHECCAALAEAYGTSNITDTVLEAMKRASASL